MISANEAFERAVEAITAPLSQRGFSKVEERIEPESFGSRYTTFGNGKEFIRLVWDGKEEWFVLESIPASTAKSATGWTNISLQFFKPRRDESEVVLKIAQDMQTALCAYLGIRPPPPASI